MAIKGHKERALLRRGHHIQEALKRRVNINELYSLRRNLIKENMDKLTELAVDCDKKLNIPYCNLKTKIDSLGSTEQDELLNDINIIFDFFTKDLNNKNTTVFRNVINVIIGLDAWENAIRVMAPTMKKGHIVLTSGETLEPTRNKIKKALNDLIDSNKEVTEKNIGDLLRDIRRIGYTEYEEKFKGNNFDLIRGQWRMPNLDLDTKSFWKTILKVYQEKTDPQKLIYHVVDVIIENKNEIFETAKADLLLKKDLYVGDEIVIPANTHIEVKKMNYTTDSYMSEFYAIYKDSSLKEKLNSLNIDPTEFLKLYNKVIDGIFVELNNRGQGIIEEAENHIFGIIYDKNILIPRLDKKGKKNFRFYWSNKGQRACDKDHRLSIRFKPTKEKVIGYQYDSETHSNQLKPIVLSIDSKENEGVYCNPVTV